MSGAKIVVVGSINMDIAVRVAALPRPGETILGSDAVLSLGGKGANQAVAAARLGAVVAMIGATGDDPFGVAARAVLEAEGIGLDSVLCLPDGATGVALITIGSDGQNMITVSPGANAAVSTSQVSARRALFAGSRVVLLQNEIPVETSLAAATLARLAGVRVLADPAPSAGYDPRLIAAADIITPNETEVTALTGLEVRDRESAVAAAARLVSLGAQTAVVKLGAAGVVYDGAEGRGHVAAPSVTAIDTVAAGDCFNGALAVALAEGQPFRDALAFACKAASIAVTRPGASASMPLRRELA